MNKPNKSVASKLLAHLEKGKSITTLEALLKWGCIRIPNRVCDLRKQGYPIISEPIRLNGKNLVRYWLA